MALRAIHSVVAVVGIAAASAGAWWYQSRPQGPTEVAAPAGPVRPGAAAPATAPGGGGAAAAAPRAAGVEVAKAERARLQDDAQSVGTLRSRQSVMLRPEVAGRVREIGFADGATVRKGQVLVQLDDTLQRAEIKQAQAQVSIAQANLKRNQELVAQSFVAQRVLDESNANLQVAEAQLALACARWSRMAILAPFDGTVGIRNVNLGDYVKDGADLVNLEDISSMYADFRLPERFQGKLRPRQSVQLQLDAFPGRMFKATVEAIDPLLDVNGRSVGVRAVLPNTMGEPLAQGGGRPGGPAAGAGAPARPSASPGAPARIAGAGASAGRAGGGRNAAVVAEQPAAAAPRGSNEPASCAGVRESAPAQALVAGRPAGGPGGAARGGPAPLRPGMFARVTTVFAIKDQAIVVPEEAIVPQGSASSSSRWSSPRRCRRRRTGRCRPTPRWCPCARRSGSACARWARSRSSRGCSRARRSSWPASNGCSATARRCVWSNSVGRRPSAAALRSRPARPVHRPVAPRVR
ncbi:efflux RND transporter periplasmic adaptor subunit [Comamonadaceae bacterium G21597-S1]|nr:efflux RND transporter periplasmic adaptor subunit [Comamonadaceae bacterium G21597-S1]